MEYKRPGGLLFTMAAEDKLSLALHPQIYIISILNIQSYLPLLHTHQLGLVYTSTKQELLKQ